MTPPWTARSSVMLYALLILAGNSMAQSGAKLEIASQQSISGNDSITLVYTQPIYPSVPDPADYSISPARTIISAVSTEDSSNVVKLKLAPSTPLLTGVTYQLQTLGGQDATGAALDPSLTSGTLVGRSILGEIANIVSCQLPDGAFSTNVIGDPVWQPGEPIRLVPYYGCMAAQGLIRGYRITRDETLLDKAKAYLQWHAARIPASNFITDYVGYYPTYNSTASYDSTDSYGALFASTLWLYFQETRDYDFLEDMYPALQKAVLAMEATLQSDSLTWATPTYKVRFTMDNAEVFQGYFAAAQLARQMGLNTTHSQWLNRANSVFSAIQTSLYLTSPGRYSKGKSNAGLVYPDWSSYYPDAMANEFALYFAHQASDARFQEAWLSEKAQFFPGNVPHPDMSVPAPLVAAKAGDSRFLDIAYARALQNHRIYYYSQDSARFLELEEFIHSRQANVPEVSTTSITIDGQLSEPQWENATRMVFHKKGKMMGFANELVYEYPANTIDPDGLWTISWLHSGTMLYVGIDAVDQYITSSDVAADSDGLSHLFIRNAANTSLFHDLSYTFFPDSGTGTVPTGPAGTILSNSGAATAAFALKSPADTPNDDTDIDQGYQMEFAIDLSHPAAGGYTGVPSELVVGLRLADMDGTPGQSWPWSNGAFGTMIQWADGLNPADYSVNTLHLTSHHLSSVESWDLY